MLRLMFPEKPFWGVFNSFDLGVPFFRPPQKKNKKKRKTKKKGGCPFGFPLQLSNKGTLKERTLPPHLFGACRALTSAQVPAPRRDLEANRRKASAWATFGSCLFFDLFVACRVIPFTNKPRQPKGTTLEQTKDTGEGLPTVLTCLGPLRAICRDVYCTAFSGAQQSISIAGLHALLGSRHWPEMGQHNTVSKKARGLTKMAFGLFRGG